MKKAIVPLLLIAAITLCSAASCQSTPSDTASAETVNQNSESIGAEEVTAEPDPLSGLDFNGADFRVYISTGEAYGILSTSPMMIAETENGEIVNDTAFSRNLSVSEKFKVNLKFTGCDLTYNNVASTIRALVLSGDDTYDLVINDIYGTVDLAVEGMFIDAVEGKYFDFTKDYWRYDYMKDISVDKEKIYILNGDYFLDSICNAHVLFVNADKFNDRYGDINVLYDEVLNNEWTIDRMIKYVSDVYSDLDGDNKRSAGDFYGYIVPGPYGSIYPFVYGSDQPLVVRDGKSAPELVMNTEKVVGYYSKIVELLNSNGSDFKQFLVDKSPNYQTKFMEGGSLFQGFSRICSLATYRAMEDNITLIPYPLMTESQKEYVTVTDDEVELGSIPITCRQLDMVSAVIEELNKITGNTVLKAYYETALKVKYVRDDSTAQMLDIVKNGLISSFPLAYNHMLDSIFTGIASSLIESNSTDFASKYTSKESAAKTALQSIYEAYKSH